MSINLKNTGNWHIESEPYVVIYVGKKVVTYRITNVGNSNALVKIATGESFLLKVNSSVDVGSFAITVWKEEGYSDRWAGGTFERLD